MRWTDDDLRALEHLIGENPELGSLIAGSGGLRKIRFAPPSWNTGKSGATRVCYAWYTRSKHIYTVAAYPKNETENLSAAQRSEAQRLLDAIAKLENQR